MLSAFVNDHNLDSPPSLDDGMQECCAASQRVMRMRQTMMSMHAIYGRWQRVVINRIDFTCSTQWEIKRSVKRTLRHHAITNQEICSLVL